MRRVLIIEDDLPYRKVYTRKFEASGYFVETAQNGAEGLHKMRQARPDIVCTDLMMPQMDGFQVLEAIKTDPNFKDIPVIVLTNLSTPEDSNKAIEKGAEGIIVKSDSEPQAVIDMANQILDRKTKANPASN